MTWALKPKIPTDATFGGEMVWNSTEMEIPATFKSYIESVSHSIKPMYINKATGFETKKYSKNDSSVHTWRIMLVGNLPRWMCEALHRLAIAMNGAGMILQFDDTWITTEGSTIYDCRWINAGDFVENSTLLCGASMNLISYDSTLAITVDEYQKVIADPGLIWDLQTSETGADNIYYRVA